MGEDILEVLERILAEEGTAFHLFEVSEGDLQDVAREIKRLRRVAVENETLKLHIWTEHIACETKLCPPGIRELICRADTGLGRQLHPVVLNKKYCVPCWQKFARGEQDE